ncbi:YchJ family protein [Paucidesulfovibrio longus]|uniref:YchJ family protein n=1 Tax=Paucidesulfovibrio longus TaxID=889 RepID=UPI0003B3A5B5|nr:YchJ family protein [Paucidesulfovibrio longus]
MSNCACGSGKALAECCGPYIEGAADAPTAEALMRSRYTAYATGKLEYLRDTLLPEEREQFDIDSARKWSESAQWDGLEIVATEDGGESDEAGKVDFIARYTQSGMRQAHRELGTFRKLEGKWIYVDGEVRGEPQRRAEPKVGRNEPCPCGSGKKYKKCCGK